MGALEPVAELGGVAFRGHRAVIHRANLESGLAAHVLVRVGRFTADRFDALERELGALEWAEWLHSGVPRFVRAHAHKSRLHHTGAIEERALRAIAKRLGDGLESPDSSGVPIQVRLVRDRVEVSIDTSGEPLHRRGYRVRSGSAPMREDLARAMILASGWDPQTPLVDPFCGSGTLPIEAAAIARRLAPGRLRSFALERTSLLHPATWARVREEADARALDAAPAPILGGDRDAAAIEGARENAALAGVSDDVRFVTASMSELDLGELVGHERGTLVANPPYGHRMGDVKALEALYRALGRRVEGLPPDWRVAVACTRQKLGSRVGRHLETALSLDSGGLSVRVLAGPARAPVEPVSTELAPVPEDPTL